MARSVLAGLWLLVFVFPVMSAADTRVDINRTKNFSLYKTFSVEVVGPTGAAGTADESNTAATKRFIQGIAHQLRSRGLEESDHPDLIVRVSSHETEKSVVTGTANPWLGYRQSAYWGGAFPIGYWGPYGGVWSFSYTKEEVVIDVRERVSGDVVYSAWVTDEAENERDELDDQAMKIGRKAFKKYPVKPQGED